MKWNLETYKVNFTEPWRISGAVVDSKEILLVKFQNGEYFGYGEIPYGSKETLDLDDIKRDLELFEYDYTEAKIVQFNDLTRFLETRDFCAPRLRFAIESAFVDYLHQATDISPWKILGTNTIKSVESVQSFSIFDSSKDGYKLLEDTPSSVIPKFKISKETIEQQMEFINQLDRPCILDANESWGTDVSGLVEVLKRFNQENILFIEQPLDKNAIEEYRELKKVTPIQVFLDETVQDHKHLNAFVDLCHGVVIKSCKSNSIMRVVSQMSQAKKLGLKTMLGCMVESSVGISALFSVCYGFDYYDFDGFTKIKNDRLSRVFWDEGKVSLSSMN